MNNLAVKDKGLLSSLAKSANLDPAEFQQTLVSTVMPGNITQEQFTAFLMVAQKYDLNPITKEIYAFPSRGGVQPIVSIDGWLKLINNNPQFDGMEFTDHTDDNGKLSAVTCKIFRKDRNHPTEVTEYMNECADKTGKSEPWARWPARMLRHKATIQAARYAFGFSGIYDPDEGERIAQSHEAQHEEQQTTVVESSEKTGKTISIYPQEEFDKNFDKWAAVIASGKKTAETLIGFIESKGWSFTAEQEAQLMNVESNNNGN